MQTPKNAHKDVCPSHISHAGQCSSTAEPDRERSLQRLAVPAPLCTLCCLAFLPGKLTFPTSSSLAQLAGLNHAVYLHILSSLWLAWMTNSHSLCPAAVAASVARCRGPGLLWTSSLAEQGVWGRGRTTAAATAGHPTEGDGSKAPQGTSRRRKGAPANTHKSMWGNNLRALTDTSFGCARNARMCDIACISGALFRWQRRGRLQTHTKACGATTYALGKI